MKRQIFRVEQKTGKMPEIAWKTVFEREINFCDDDDVQFNSIVPRSARMFSITTDSIMEALRFLYSGEQYRVILICE